MEITPEKSDLKLKIQEKKLPISTCFQLGAILLPPPYPGPLAMSGDIFHCHNLSRGCY